MDSRRSHGLTSNNLARRTAGHAPFRTASLIDPTPPWAVIPPCTGISAPDMNDASSLIKNRARGDLVDGADPAKRGFRDVRGPERRFR